MAKLSEEGENKIAKLLLDYAGTYHTGLMNRIPKKQCLSLLKLIREEITRTVETDGNV